MINLTTINNGFVMNESEYFFDGQAEILDKTQAHVPTNQGTIFCDITISVNEEIYTNINDFLTALYEQ